MRSSAEKRTKRQPVLKWALIFITLISYAAIAACHSRQTDQGNQNAQKISVEESQKHEQKEPSANQAPPPVIETVSANEKRVSFAGVSFVYDPAIFSEVKAEVVPARPLDCDPCKPDGSYPRHLLFSFPHEESDGEPYPFSHPSITVFTLDDFRRAYSISKDMVREIDADIAKLKKLFFQRSISPKTKIPFLEYLDASRSFQSHIKQVEFQNGKGILVLTQYSVEMENIYNEKLEYLFQGITADGKYSVKAWFLTRALHFPDDSYQMPFYPYEQGKADANIKAYDAYLARMQHKIAALPPADFSPSLLRLEKLIRSIRVESDTLDR